jgi:hypothetical protein
MAADWEKLAGEWADHKVGLVAEVDCTTDDGQKLCEENGVEGFPTIMYGDPGGLEVRCREMLPFTDSSSCTLYESESIPLPDAQWFVFSQSC